MNLPSERVENVWSEGIRERERLQRISEREMRERKREREHPRMRIREIDR